MARRAAQRVEDGGHTEDPSRPDNIPAQDGDDEGSLIDINAKDKPATVDVNAVRDEDARSDAEKEAERVAAEEREQRSTARGLDRTSARDDDDESTLSRNMQRRLERERALRRKSDEQVSNLRAQLDTVNERLKITRADPEALTKNVNDLRAKLADLKKKLVVAKEAGNSVEEADITEQMGELQAQIVQLDRDIKVAKEAPAPVAAVAADPVRPPLVDDWMRANRRWFDLPSNRVLRDTTIALDKQIKADIKDGDLDFEEYSEEHMDHLTKMVAKEALKLNLDVEIRDIDGKPYELPEDEDAENNSARTGRRGTRDVNTRGNGARPPQGGTGGREGRRGNLSDLELAKQGKVRLNEQDYAQMRVFKLDPNDPVARRTFGKERIRTILTEANRGRGASR